LPDVRAILVADIHLQARAPVCRAGEPDWFAAMAKPLEELYQLTETHDVPVIYAGDIFDRWCVGPEVINFALEHLPRGYAVPGQHDLPNHNYNEIERSAYWTLVEANHIGNLKPGEEVVLPGNIVATGWPWGFTPEPLPKERRSTVPNIAVVHSLIWTKGTGYPGAPAAGRVGAYNKALAGYDVAVFGDNHKGFITETKGGVTVCNCGGFMRRKSDECDYRPGVGLLHGDGTVVRHYLDTTGEHFAATTAAEKVVEDVLDMGAFVEGLRGLGAQDALDFVAALRRFIADNKTPQRVTEIILEACEGE